MNPEEGTFGYALMTGSFSDWAGFVFSDLLICAILMVPLAAAYAAAREAARPFGAPRPS